MTTPLRLPTWERHYCPRCHTVLNRAIRWLPVNGHVEPKDEWRCTVCDETFLEEQTLRQPAPAHEVGPPAKESLAASPEATASPQAPVAARAAAEPTHGMPVPAPIPAAGPTTRAPVRTLPRYSPIAWALAWLIPLAVIAWVVLFLLAATGWL